MRIARGVLSISIGVETLKWAAEHCEQFWQPATDKYSLVVADADLFAAEIVNQLLAEQEDGTTPVHVMLDAAFKEATEQGAEGIDIDAMDAIEAAERAENCEGSEDQTTTEQSNGR